MNLHISIKIDSSDFFEVLAGVGIGVVNYGSTLSLTGSSFGSTLGSIMFGSLSNYSSLVSVIELASVSVPSVDSSVSGSVGYSCSP